MYRLVNLSKYYNSDSKVNKALDSINLEIKENEFVVITGPSGSGKSTLLNILSGIDSYQDGEMYFKGQETSYYDEKDYEKFRQDNISFVFQEYNLIESYSAYENIKVAFVGKGLFYTDEDILSLLDKVGIKDKKDIKAAKLSGGEKARLAIARALALNTKVLVLDEPTGALDSINSKEIVNLLATLKGTKTIIVVTHDEKLFSKIGNHFITISDGKIKKDKVIKEEISVLNQEESKTYKKNKPTLIASLNMKNQPKKSALTFSLVFVFVCFITILISSISYVSHQSDAPNPLLGQSLNRLVINNKEGLDDNDLSKFEKDSDLVIKENELLDSYFTVNFDSLAHTGLEGSGLSYTHLKESDLKVGRLPAANDEIVLPYNKKIVNNFDKVQDKYIYLKKDYSNNFKCKVVGVSSTPYFYFYNASTLNNLLANEAEITIPSLAMTVSLDYSAPIDKIYLKEDMSLTINNKEVNYEISNDARSDMIVINPDYFNSFYESVCKGWSLFVSSPSDYVKDLDSSYTYFIPNIKKDTYDSGIVTSTIMSLGALLICYLLVILCNYVFKQIYRYKKKDNAILNTLGYSSKDIKHSLLIELSIWFSSSFVFMTLLMILDKYLNIFKGFLGMNSIWSYLFMLAILVISLFSITYYSSKEEGNDSLFKKLRGGDDNA